ncbi:TlpA disulfide reductase family protein [Sphingomonas sp. KR1UV-12]|uniref:TlpA disulfide reductase family protein n=1 Tax=Sphingomonas aurea TaxID=3063994 RepID=A0ABT9ELQ5_9SPHN|nr:TlpA disulfide reductase family protein [Sphingomonas sp. KR1UV-12]MDP1027903.1 TlpA disulfide reductase family protein [Sphingomonas sp. KR1UV-12]
MRSAIVPAVLAALLAAPLIGCGDRASNDAGQGNAASPASPDEAAPAAPQPKSGGIDTSHKGEAAPTLGFVDPAGKPVTLAAWRGKPVLLNLWATWCGPCVKELPTLDALAVREAGKLAVVTLSQDMDPAKVAPFFAERKFKALKAYTDPKMAWVPAVANNLPTSILYDAQGKEVWRTVGDLDWTGAVAAKALEGAGV